MESNYTQTCRKATTKTLAATSGILNKCAGVFPRRRSNAVIGTVLFGWFYICWRVIWFLTVATCVLAVAMGLLAIAATVAPFWGIGVVVDSLRPRSLPDSPKIAGRTRYPSSSRQ